MVVSSGQPISTAFCYYTVLGYAVPNTQRRAAVVETDVFATDTQRSLHVSDIDAAVYCMYPLTYVGAPRRNGC